MYLKQHGQSSEKVAWKNLAATESTERNSSYLK
jgi:hypothetical protein